MQRRGGGGGSGGTALQEPIEDRLRNVARARTAALGLRSGEAFAKELDGLLDQAAARMRSEGRDDEANVRAAEAVVAFLIEALVFEGKSMGYTDAQVAALEAALRLHCPIWPFC